MVESSMNPQSGSGAAGPDVAALERSIDDAKRKLSELQEIQSASRIQLGILVAAIVVIMLIFGYQTYVTVRRNFDPQQLQRAMIAKAEALVPDVRDEVMDAIMKAKDAYIELGRERFTAALPTLRKDVEKRVQEFGPKVHDLVNGEIEAALKRVSAKVEAETRKAFPSLTAAKAQQTMEQFEGMIALETEKLMKKVNTLFNLELKRVERIMNKFPQPDMEADLHELEKKFVMDLLDMVKFEVARIGTGDELNLHQPVQTPELGLPKKSGIPGAD